ncbi:MAG: response regulator [Myxococcales bacterium]|nr:response regulator [Myxococcales bacterium]
MSVTHSARVLIVEDNDADAELVRIALARLDGASMTSTRARSIDEIDHEAVATSDVVLLDLGLPGSRGLETLHRARAVVGRTPIIVLSGMEDETLALACVREGAQDYLHKAELATVNLRRAIGFALSRAHEERIRQLEREMSAYRALSSEGSATSVTRALTAGGPIQTREPERFDALVERYADTLERYVDQVVRSTPKPSEPMGQLATALGDLGAGPRDLIDLHLAGLRRATAGREEGRARAMSVDGRLLALEMMGLLVDYYRTGRRSRQPVSSHGTRPT